MKCRVFSIRADQEHLAIDEAKLNHFLQDVKVSRVLASLVGGSDIWSVLMFYEEVAGEPEHEVDDLALSPEEEEVYSALRAWRAERAMGDGVVPYMVAHNAWLKQMARTRPKTVADLLKVRGFGEKRVEKYGHDLIAIITGLYRLTSSPDDGASRP